MQIRMHPMYSMLYTANLGLCDYVLFSQIQSHIIYESIIIINFCQRQGLHKRLCLQTCSPQTIEKYKTKHYYKATLKHKTKLQAVKSTLM